MPFVKFTASLTALDSTLPGGAAACSGKGLTRQAPPYIKTATK
jgi:hypothetical protein